MKTMGDLVGKTIESVHVQPQGMWIQFGTDAGPLALVANGDCCSRSWINDIEGVGALVGGEVLEVEEWTPPADRVAEASISDYNGGELKLYGYKLRTDKGYAAIEFRNESNGYYGGSLEYAKPTDVSGMMGLETEDWRCQA